VSAEKLRAECSGILNWAIKGCLDWQRNGLQKPAVVQAATNEYRNQEDVIGQFLADCCVVNEQGSAGATDLYERYERWGGELSQTRFGRSLAERGFISGRASSGVNKGRKAWRGIDLVDQE
jgi:putative DNA primase/helicase